MGSKRLFVFGRCDAGVVFKPSVARIRCGNAADAGGKCGSPCPGVGGSQEKWSTREYPGDGCGTDGSARSWAPRDSGPYLQRVTLFQKSQSRDFYNEFIVDCGAWNSKLPHSLEAMFTVSGNSKPGMFGRAWVEGKHAEFAKLYGLRASDVPLVTLHLDRWKPGPFSS